MNIANFILLYRIKLNIIMYTRLLIEIKLIVDYTIFRKSIKKSMYYTDMKIINIYKSSIHFYLSTDII
jgi:hypothetical protein